MKVIFCDLCALPIKEKKYKLTISVYYEQPTANFETEAEGSTYYMKKGFIEEKTVEICEKCKEIIDQIFEKRMKGIIKLSEDLQTIYDQPVKEPEYKKEQKKKKDKTDKKED